MAKKKSITAEELMRRLEADSEWVAQRDAKVALGAERSKSLRADESSILADLNAVNVTVSSVYDFVNKQPAPDMALPVLVKHLNLEHHPRIREGIIQALGMPRAREIAFDALCQAYSSERDVVLRWVIANALSGMARLEELANLPGIEEFARLFPRRRTTPPSS